MSEKDPSQRAQAEVERLTRRMRLPYMRKAAPEVLATARSQRWDPAEVLRALLEEEGAGRDKATISNSARKTSAGSHLWERAVARTSGAGFRMYGRRMRRVSLSTSACAL